MLRTSLFATVLLLAGCTVNANFDFGHLPDPLEAGWQGEPVCEALEESPNLRVLMCTFPPGIGHERHFHPEHMGYVLDGSTMQITDSEGTRTVDIPAGTTWRSDGVAWHEVVNVGDTTGRYLIVEPK